MVENFKQFFFFFFFFTPFQGNKRLQEKLMISELL